MSTIHNINPNTLSQWLKTKEALLVDVREPAEYSAECIEHAKNIPLSQLTVSNAKTPEHKNKKLVIHCHSGRRSVLASEKLEMDNAPYDIWLLEGGITAWKEAKLPVKCLGRKILALDRQVQLAVGIFILIGMILGHFVSYNWFILPLIFGLGLTNAGLTGCCGGAKLIAKMPWNQK